MEVLSAKKIVSKLSDYKILLTNGELVDCIAESYYAVGTDEGEMIVYQFTKDKKIILEIDASKIEAIIDSSAVNVEQIVNALKKKKPIAKRKKPV